MGAREEDYQRSAPYKSYLHVDQFEDPEHLAKFLHRLDQDDQLYNQYFQVRGTCFPLTISGLIVERSLGTILVSLPRVNEMQEKIKFVTQACHFLVEGNRRVYQHKVLVPRLLSPPR